MGDHPEFELGVQLFTEEQAAKWDFDILDATKIVPEELVPVRPIGKMTLNRNPDNFFAETEQAAFHPGHVVPRTGRGFRGRGSLAEGGSPAGA